MKHIQINSRYIFTFFVFLLSLAVSAQKKSPYEMMVSGVKVIVQPSNNDIVEIQTIIKGGVQNYSGAKAGIERLAMTALTECGTAKDDKNTFKNKLDKLSAQVDGNSHMDYAVFRMNCIKSDFESVWPLYADAFTTPRFDDKEFLRIRQDAINSLKAQSSQPDYAIEKMAKQTAFAGKDYAKSPEGTEASVSKLTSAETKAYYKSILTKSRLLIIVVGELDRSLLEQKISAMLAAVPQGVPFMQKKQSFMPTATTFKSEKKDLATNYIQAVSSAPLPGTSDYNSFLLAMRIFYDRNFLEVRSNHGLSYAPYAYFDGGLGATGNIGVSTTEPNKYIAVVTNLVDKTRKEGFTAEEVENMKRRYITRFYYNQETNNAQAGVLAQNEVLFSNWRRALTLNDELKNLSVADVNKAFNKYVSNLTWVYQGDPAKVDAALYTGKDSKMKLPPSKVKKAGEKE